ncbi:MAG: hypothetical protein HYV26_13265 [Candidatus Hydrogenedentes bacterium]|nr:hypothetical protein [Candidatus Hydrogenedentota bacterium]
MKQQESSGFWKTPGGVRDICTTSGVRAWWLSTVRGYQVRSIVQMPRVGSFGRVRYYRRWISRPVEEKVE